MSLNPLRPTGAVLLTGATGQVGSHLLVDLLRSGRRVIALVRGENRAAAEKRVEKLLCLFEQTLGETLPRPWVVPGDINLPGLGLEYFDAADVRAAVSTVVHSAAFLSFRPAAESHDNEPFRTNVDGLRNVIAFGKSAGVTDWHVVSTAFVCGLRDGVVSESDSDLGQEYANDYERSKVRAEQVAREEIPADQLTIYRPSIVLDTAVPYSNSDRTVYHVLELYTRLKNVIPKPNAGELPALLGLNGSERKNLVEASWVSKVIVAGVQHPEFHGKTLHVTSREGVRVSDLDTSFLDVVSRAYGWPTAAEWTGRQVQSLDGIASTFLSTFAPYFRCDPTFDRANLDDLLVAAGLSDHYEWNQSRANDFAIQQLNQQGVVVPEGAAQKEAEELQPETSSDPNADGSVNGANQLVIVGMWAKVPGADGLDQFEQLFADGRAGYSEMPPERYDYDLYFDENEGVAGKTYTRLGGVVPDQTIDRSVCPVEPDAESVYDPSHLRFCETAARAWRFAGLKPGDDRLKRTGVFVGHSGGTERGGPLSLTTTLARYATDLASSKALSNVPPSVRDQVVRETIDELRSTRPRRNGENPKFDAFMAAALASQTLELEGPCHVVDAACASSLVALDQAAMAIESGQIDAAIVGGSTYNGVDNLILFSHSRACSRGPSRPFDERANGLVSSEGYVALVVTTKQQAVKHGLSVLVEIGGVGTSSDGRGKSLWAPREEGQRLALQRAYAGKRRVLDVDTLECHATSTSLGDATELAAIAAVAERTEGPLPIGSAKSNLGHTLEAAGLIGVVKTILAMRRGERFPSIGFEQPSKSIDWANSPFRVVTNREPWQRREAYRTGAVSAFGIGGLNAHAWVRESTNELAASSPHHAKNNFAEEPIAIVGRGCVLPSAENVKALGELIESGRTGVGVPPESRWRGLSAEAGGIPTNHGGYIHSFEFDAAHYRVLPLQVRRANPAQFMLLEAVAQAAREAGADEKIGHPGVPWPFEAERTAVVVGSIFGGEFSNELQLGLRLPEIHRLIERRVALHGAADPAGIAEQITKETLELYPALLDETGSFTASTLASRIAKTFDLMGGAAAIDAGEGSGLAALIDAMVKLRSGRVDTVVCAVVQRAMDLPAYERLSQIGHLVASGNSEDVPDDCSRILPGEGVSVVILRRLCDAKADGNPVHAVLRDFTVDRCEQPLASEDARVVRAVGYLSGAHPVVRLVAETATTGAAHSTLASTDARGVVRRITVQYPDRVNRQPVSRPAPPIRQQPPASLAKMNDSTCPSTMTAGFVRIQASSRAEFEQQLTLASNGNAQAVDSFSADMGYRFVCTGSDPAVAAIAVLKQLNRGDRSGVDLRTAALFVTPDVVTASPRMAWMYPGQGSLPSAWPEGVVPNDALAAQINTGLTQHNDKAVSFECLAGKSIGDDLWSSQFATLAWSMQQTQLLEQAGLRPDSLVGHSFGECGAAWAAGVLDVAAALRLSRLRADLICSAAGSGGGLISIRATPPEVQGALSRSGLRSAISHHNAPQQTVVSVIPGEMDRVRQALKDAGLANVPIPVAVPFHSAALASAEAQLSTAFSPSVCRPPRNGFISATHARYLAEPAEIHRSLVGQLTQPVLFCETVSRLLNDGTRLFVECGPGSVLSRLVSENAGDAALCIPLDDDVDRRLPLVLAAQECMGVPGSAIAKPVVANAPAQSRTVVSTPPASDVDFIDVTKSRKARGQAPRSVAPTATSSLNGSAPAPTAPAFSAPVANVNVAGTNGSVPKAASLVPSSPVDSNGSAGEPSTGGISHADALTFLTDLTVELTGYNRDVIDSDADLEADLGVDSIKKAQLIGELAEWSGWTERPAGLKLEDVKTLDAIARLASNNPSGGKPTLPATQPNSGSPSQNGHGPLTPSSNGQHSTSSNGYHSGLSHNGPSQNGTSTTNSAGSVAHHSGASTNVSASSVSASTAVQSRNATLPVQPRTTVENTATDIVVSAAELEAMLIDMLVVQTGYAPDVIDLDADLEADLGVDSIKHAQLIGELYAHFNLTAEVQKGTGSPIRSLSEFRSLRSIQKHLLDRLSAAGVSAKSDVVEANDDQHARATDSTQPLPTNAIEAATIGSVASPEPNDTLQVEPAGDHTQRFALRVVPAPRRDRMPDLPPFVGPSLIIGDGDIAQALAEKIRTAGHAATVIDPQTVEQAETAVEQVWQSGITPHLFLCSAVSDDAIRFVDPTYWATRRVTALTVPYRICQLWYERTIEAGLMDNASVVALTRLGGDYGFGNPAMAPSIGSPEGGGLGGLVKAMLIEAWMRGFRSTPMKVIDVAEGLAPNDVAKFALKELAVPSYDMEVAFDGSQRLAVQAFPKPISSGQQPRRSITRGGLWIVAGGGRGISPACALELSKRHDLKLALLGTAPVPAIDRAIIAEYDADRSALRRRIVREATGSGTNSLDAWRDLEKAVEIVKTVDTCRQAGVEAEYYSCDVADVASVRATLSQARQRFGPIRGVLQGAGAGQDSRFDRKQPDKVNKCLKAKIDGALALAAATFDDPLEWFVGFGSISGRFGANGHTDYSLANDMLAKCIGLIRRTRDGSDGRPPVAACTFHWHAWDDIGMATKPEAKLALEMIDMEFMPAVDGIGHFLREIEHGGDESEVLITDENYFRKFFPADRIADSSAGGVNASVPMLGNTGSVDGAVSWTLDPVKDRFLAEHRVRQRPTLPFVVAIEAMAEAALMQSGKQRVVAMRNVAAEQALKFATDDCIAVTIPVEVDSQADSWRASLRADIRRRDGRLIAENREYFHGTVETTSSPLDIEAISRQFVPSIPTVDAEAFQPVAYLGDDAPIFHGEPLRTLRKFAVADGCLIGKLAGPAQVELFGESRGALGWVWGPAAADGCLYAVAVLAHAHFGRPSLPVRFGEIRFGRTGDPGEPLTVLVVPKAGEANGATFDWTLVGANGDLLIHVTDYQVAWLS